MNPKDNPYHLVYQRSEDGTKWVKFGGHWMTFETWLRSTVRMLRKQSRKERKKIMGYLCSRISEEDCKKLKLALIGAAFRMDREKQRSA